MIGADELVMAAAGGASYLEVQQEEQSMHGNVHHYVCWWALDWMFGGREINGQILQVQSAQFTVRDRNFAARA